MLVLPNIHIHNFQKNIFYVRFQFCNICFYNYEQFQKYASLEGMLQIPTWQLMQIGPMINSKVILVILFVIVFIKRIYIYYFF